VAEKVMKNRERSLKYIQTEPKEKIKINEGEKNYLKFMLYQNIPKGNTLYPNQIIIPIGKVFPVFDLVSEIQADIEIDNF